MRGRLAGVGTCTARKAVVSKEIEILLAVGGAGVVERCPGRRAVEERIDKLEKGLQKNVDVAVWPANCHRSVEAARSGPGGWLLLL